MKKKKKEKTPNFAMEYKTNENPKIDTYLQ
jgi:hypothetical protein